MNIRPNRLLPGVLLCGTLLFLLLIFLGRSPELRLAPASPRKATSATPTPGSPAVPATTTATTSVRRGGHWQRLLADSQVIRSLEEKPDGEGKFRRHLLLKTKSKYARVQLDERVRRLPDGTESVLEQTAFAARHVVVRPHPEITPAEMETFAAKLGFRVLQKKPLSGLYLIEFPDDAGFDGVENALAQLQTPGAPVRFAEPDYLLYPLDVSLPDDPDFGRQSGLKSSGENGEEGDIDVLAAWDFHTGSAKVLVGVIDSGIDYLHPDLQANIWSNPKEIPGNRIDDDRNGYVDDVRGWDFLSNDAKPMDEDGHGTHCAGTIGAVGNNGIGITGVCMDVTLVPLRVLGYYGASNSDVTEALAYATRVGVAVTSNSYGGTKSSRALREQIEMAGKAGALFVSAAGNEGDNLDYTSFRPGTYGASNIINVAATNASDQLAGFSNYGVKSVDIAAPGVRIYSTVPGGRYHQDSGTSMAAPFVTGAVALLKSAYPGLSGSKIKELLLSSADRLPALEGKILSGGRLNVAQAMRSVGGPYLVIPSYVLKELSRSSIDGIYSPGEDFSLSLQVKNLGDESAEGVKIELAESLSWEISQGETNLADLPPRQTSGTSTDLRFRIKPDTKTPRLSTLRVLLSDAKGGNWTQEISLQIQTATQIRGMISAVGGGTVPGATIAYSGVTNGSTEAGEDGSYSLTLPAGQYALTAGAAGYVTSAPVTVAATIGVTHQDFAIGTANLQVDTDQYDVRLKPGESKSQILQLTNHGTLPVTYQMGSIFDFEPPAGTSAGILPLFDDFEDGNPRGWNVLEDSWSYVRKTVVSPQTSGETKSLRISNIRFTGNGYGRFLGSGAHPEYVSFRIKLPEPDQISCFKLGKVIEFASQTDGTFAINRSAGGAKSWPFVPNQWYQVEFRNINWETRRFSCYIDGKAVQFGIPLLGKANTATHVILLSSSAYCVTFWDDIRVEDHRHDWVSVSRSSGSIAPGQTLHLRLNFDTGNLPAGTYSGMLDLQSNDPGSPARQIPISLQIPNPDRNNLPPVSVAQRLSLDEDIAEVFELSAEDPDGDATSVRITKLPSQGRLFQTTDGITRGEEITHAPSSVVNADRKLIFVSQPDQFGRGYGKLEYCASDNQSETVSTIIFDVNAVNDPPIAYPDKPGALPGETVTFDPIANDYDAEKSQLTLLRYGAPGRGAVVQNGNSLTYTPSTSFTGEDSFNYTVQDAGGARTTGIIKVRFGPLSGGDWTTTGRDATRNSYYPGKLQGRKFRFLWERPYRTTPVCIVDSHVYFSDGGKIYSLQLETGSIEWSRQMRGAGSITYHSGKLCFTTDVSDEGVRVHCVSAVDGADIWEAFIGEADWGSMAPLVSDEGTFVPIPSIPYDYSGDDPGAFAGFDRDGRRLFRFNGWDFYGGWTPSTAGGLLYIYEQGDIRARSPLDGKVVWECPADSWYYNEAKTAVYADDALFVRSGYGMVAVSTSTHKLLWQSDKDYVGVPTVAQGAVYVGYKYGLRALDAKNGNFIRDYGSSDFYPSHFNDAPIVTDDTVIAANGDTTYVFDRESGKRLQSIYGGDSVSLSNGYLLVASYDGLICMVVESDNQAPTANPIAATVTEDTTSLIALSGSDPEQEKLFGVVTSLPAHGQLFQTEDGVTPLAQITKVPASVSHPGMKLLYAPEPDGAGDGFDSFKFKVQDGRQLSDVAVLTINVTNVNDGPIGLADNVTLSPSQSLSNYRPQLNDVDVDEDLLRIISFTQGTLGSISLNADGSLRYTPNSSKAEGTDHFKYVAEDAGGKRTEGSVTVTLSGASGNTWPTFGNDAGRSGYQPYSLGSKPFELKWRTALGGEAVPPIASNDTVFVASGAKVSAVDQQTGGILWRTPLPGYYTSVPTWSDQQLYLENEVTTDGAFYCFNAQTGAQNWKFKTGLPDSYYASKLIAAPAIPGKTWLICDGGLYGFDAISGDRFFHRSYYPYDVFSVSYADGEICDFENGDFKIYDAETGSKLGSYRLTKPGDYGDVTAAPIAISNGFAYLVVSSDVYNQHVQLICFDLVHRSIAWQRAGKFKLGKPAVGGGLVYAVEGTDLKAFGCGQGNPIAQISLNGLADVMQEPIVTNDMVIAGAGSSIYFLKPDTLELLQKLDVGGYTCLVRDTLFVAKGKYLSAFSRRDQNNNPPVATTANYGIDENASKTITLAGADQEDADLSYLITALPTGGKLYEVIDAAGTRRAVDFVPYLLRNADHQVIFEPTPDLAGKGIGTFSFVVSDGNQQSVASQIVINARALNDPPRPQDDHYFLEPGEILSPINFLDNDSDVEGSLLTLTAFTQPAQGTVRRNADDTLRFEPPANVTSADVSFQYTVQDQQGLKSSATVHIAISRSSETWESYGNRPDHTGFADVNIGRESLVKLWQRNVDTGQVAVGDGKVFYTGGYSAAYAGAFNAGTGVVIWRKKLGSYVNVASPTWYAGQLLIDRDGKLLWLDTATGEEKLSANIGGFSYGEPYAPVASSLGIFVDSGGIIGSNAKTGERLFFKKIYASGSWIPTVYNGRLFTYADGKLREHDPATGAVLWFLAVDPRIISDSTPPSFAQNRAFITMQAINDLRPGVICIDLQQHKSVWQLRGQYLYGTVTIDGDTGYVFGGGGVTSFDLATGTIGKVYRMKLDYNEEGGGIQQPVVTHDTVIASASESTFVWDKVSGVQRQKLSSSGIVSVAGRRIFVAGGGYYDSTTHITAYGAAPALEFLPPAGSLNAPTSVTINALDGGKQVHYTIDGSAPTLQSPSIPSGSTVMVAPGTTVRAISVHNSSVSRIQQASYPPN